MRPSDHHGSGCSEGLVTVIRVLTAAGGGSSVGRALGVAAPVLKLQRARIKTRVFSYFGKFKTF
jgi:hypothetical protein